MQVGGKIREHLIDIGISQTELSILTGISLSKINMVLNGKRRLPIDEYEVICGVLKLPAGSFLEPKLPEFIVNSYSRF